jgi:hypothetical protein
MNGLRWMAGTLLLVAATLVQAHRPSDAFLTLDVQGREIGGQWEIALRDLDAAVGLDSNHDNQLTWGELRGARQRLEERLLADLSVSSDGAPCALQVTDLQLNDRVDGRFAWFTLAGQCDKPPATLAIGYRFLFELDPTHRGILALTAGSASHSAVLGPDELVRSFELASPSVWSAFRDYLKSGIWHIWIGYDHILFLLALLLPAVLSVSNGQWTPQPRLRPALWNVFGVVTAFTLAHSVTLTLAALGVLRLPGALVESAIAVSVMLAALNNIRPVVERARWAMAFGFGLIHGFGFASVLGELGLPQDAKLLALVAFNLGVEIGQLGIVVVAVPLAFWMRHTAFYRTGVRVVGSAVVAMLALWWLLQRSGVL